MISLFLQLVRICLKKLILIITALGLATSVAGTNVKEEIPKGDKGDVRQLIRVDPKHLNESIYELEPQWAGHLKVVFYCEFGTSYIRTNVEPMQFTHFFPAMERNGIAPYLCESHMAQGKWVPSRRMFEVQFGYIAFYRERLPEIAEIAKAKSAEDLRTLLGEPNAPTDAWSSDGRSHGLLIWRLFTLSGTNDLRVIHVFADVSGPNVKAATEIDGLEVKEGFLHPAKKVRGIKRMWGWLFKGKQNQEKRSAPGVVTEGSAG